MHWFWVTLLLSLIASGGRTFAAPQSEELQHVATEAEVELQRHSERQARAMYFTKSVQIVPTRPTVASTTEKTLSKNSTGVTQKNVTLNITTEVAAVLWTPVNSSEISNTSIRLQSNTTNNVTELYAYKNLTGVQNTTFPSKKRNLTRPDYVKDDTSVEGISESRIVTEKPLSLETTLLQTRIPPIIESSRRVIDPGSNRMDTGAIAGISFAAVVLAALAGSTAFVLYRRRYLNKPQTLNDKCSNPDSSGYLDDSTIRDNSEEMYSLDNDSFLNSLEAMTIQNYWTDTVKHTKL
ncbi:unnamed protein product [Parnassius apollo]|uniref:(apollo) hypothetical protein n=1 Tax=Parnassius apollo TaxID=110799 RepID=A0A8S3WR87_PARAO|nr:unnamed protein product [Parnassius apollo]